MSAAITTSNTAAGTWNAYVHIETRTEYFHRRSNEHADLALQAGLAGLEELAAMFAEAADFYEKLAGINEAFERL